MFGFVYFGFEEYGENEEFYFYEVEYFGVMLEEFGIVVVYLVYWYYSDNDVDEMFEKVFEWCFVFGFY